MGASKMLPRASVRRGRDDQESARARLIGSGFGAEADGSPAGTREVDGYRAHSRALWLGQSEIGLHQMTQETPEE